MTVSSLWGIDSEMFLRLWTRAPRILMKSCTGQFQYSNDSQMSRDCEGAGDMLRMGSAPLRSRLGCEWHSGGEWRLGVGHEEEGTLARRDGGMGATPGHYHEVPS